VAAAQKDAERIGVHHEPPVRLGGVSDRPGLAGAGVVDQDVQSPEAVFERRQRHEPVDVAGHVQPMVEHPIVPAGGDRRAVVVEIGRHHPCPFRQEALDDGAADAAQASGDQSDAVLEAVHGRRGVNRVRSAR